VNIVLTHVEPEHAVPDGARRHAPVFEQPPVCPQGGEGVQVPEQQIPLLPQMPLWHWSLAEQAPPLPFLRLQPWVEVLQ
jgi:hypothetical protein